MNLSALSDNEETLTDELLDRLVDGELSPAEHRAVLEQLENSPIQWRRVGLAFLEAQTLRRTCQDWIAPTIPAVMMTPTTKNIPHSRRGVTHFLLTGAAVLLAFFGGMHFGRPWSIATESAPTVAVAPQSSEQNDEATVPVMETVPVSFQYGDGALSHPVATPVVDASSPVGQAWLHATPGVPDRVREMLLRHGQKLVERQEWVEVDLADGRRGYLPVQEWTVSPVSLADFR